MCIDEFQTSKKYLSMYPLINVNLSNVIKKKLVKKMKKSKKNVHEKALDNSFDLKAAELVQLYINKKVNKVEGKLKKSVPGYRHTLANAIQSLQIGRAHV